MESYKKIHTFQSHAQHNKLVKAIAEVWRDLITHGHSEAVRIENQITFNRKKAL
jgi:hypothetical protein